MLQTLSISDFALIEQQQLDFKSGLTVISGETGAGKSILIDAFAMLMGKRANRDLLRDGKDRAHVEAVFGSPDLYLPIQICHDLGLNDDDQLILSRELRSDGRSYARINGRLVTLSLLEEVAAKLIAIHGQNSQEEIYRPEAQVRLLDNYGGPTHRAALEAWQEGVLKRRKIVSELKDLGLSPKERRRELELLDYQIDELHKADLKPGEDQKLERLYKKLSALSKINYDLDLVENYFSAEGGQGIREQIQLCLKALEYPARFVKKLDQFRADLLEISESIRDLSYRLGEVRDQLESDSNSIAEVTERLEEINELKRKYGDSISEIEGFLAAAIERREYLLTSEQRFAQLHSDLAGLESELKSKAELLTQERRKSARALSREMEAALRDLNLPKASFAVKFGPEPLTGFPLPGRDQIEFEFSANQGEGLKPLARVASGGEASRLILAMKSILADQAEIPVLIFDEIDQGIGGDTAAKVGQRLRLLSRGRQVFCVTHSASIAAMADTHILLEKTYRSGRTTTSATKLDGQERRSEIARLLSGQEGGQASLDLADSLLQWDQRIEEN